MDMSEHYIDAEMMRVVQDNLNAHPGNVWIAVEAKAWERERNEKKIVIQWRFITNHAREKLKRHYEVGRDQNVNTVGQSRG